MTGFVLEGETRIRKSELGRATPWEGEVLLRIERVGICGSDIEYYGHF
jgi:threonine dehydrogenase-like Zn-dependent dehydrogenase